jgi:hypothetical protein
MCVLRRRLEYGPFRVLIALLSASVLSATATASSRAEAARAAFRVTLGATLTKDWNYVVQDEQNGCPARTRVQGRRVVRVRSSRPSLVFVTFAGGRARYSPAVVRFISGKAAQTGSILLSTGEPPSCAARSVRQACARPKTSVAGLARFFRSGRNEISFARTRSLAGEFPTACPPQAGAVRTHEPSLHLAEGEISEADLRNPRLRAQTATGSAEETTEFTGDADGRVVVRVSWELTFRRVR